MPIMVPRGSDSQDADKLSLVVGDRVRFVEEGQRYTVRAVTSGGRFAICTKPFNLKHTVLYTVIDFERGVRGADNYYGLGYETDEQVSEAAHCFDHTDRGDGPEITNSCEQVAWCRGGAEVSRRNYVGLHIASVRPGGGA